MVRAEAYRRRIENHIRAGNAPFACVARMTSRDHHRRPMLGAAVLVLLGLLGAGCGKGSDAPDAGSGRRTTTTLDMQVQGVKFAECMRANGVADFPDPEPDGDFEYGVSVTPEVWLQTLATCKDLQPPGTLSGKRTPEEQSASLKFARCVRDHGVKDFPDPVNGEPLIDTYKIPSSDSEDGMRILNAAAQACRDVMREAIGSEK